MSRLKQATRTLHAQVETCMPVMHPGLGMKGYVQLLHQLYGVVQPLEAQLFTMSLPLQFDLRFRLKAHLLLRDLATQTVERPVTPVEPPLEGVPEALGALYVLEGSTLGGQVILRHLQQHLGVTSEHGGAYFHAYGTATGQMWRDFGNAMDHWGTDGDEARVISGANATFQKFQRAFTDVPT